MTSIHPRRIRFAPGSHDEFDRGVSTIVRAVSPSLGPVSRHVAIERGLRTVTPELLDDGAAIARRIIALGERRDDPGAMYLRGLLWRIHEEAGDGTATAAMLFHSILRGGRRAIASGIPAQPLRQHLEAIADQITHDLAARSQPCRGAAMLRGIARSVAHDPELAIKLADAMDVVGESGQIDIRQSRRRESWHEFVQGAFWESGLLSTPAFTDLARQRSDIHDAAIFITNLPLDDPYALIPIIVAAQKRPDTGGLFILAPSVSPIVAGMLHANSNLETFPIAAAKTPVQDQMQVIADISIMTGATALLREAGHTIASFNSDHFGDARTAWVTRQQMGIIGGGGDPRARRRHVETIRASWIAANAEASPPLLRRLGRFHGMSSTIWIGANSDLEAKTRTANAERVIGVLRHALRDGVLPGGGASLLSGRRVLIERLAESHDEIEQAALRIAIEALAAPITMMLKNSGLEPAPILGELERGGAEGTFDILTHRHVDAMQAGIVDPTHVLTTVTRRAMHAAALALTIDVVIQTRHREASVDPEGGSS